MLSDTRGPIYHGIVGAMRHGSTTTNRHTPRGSRFRAKGRRGGAVVSAVHVARWNKLPRRRDSQTDTLARTFRRRQTPGGDRLRRGKEFCAALENAFSIAKLPQVRAAVFQKLPVITGDFAGKRGTAFRIYSERSFENYRWALADPTSERHDRVACLGAQP